MIRQTAHLSVIKPNAISYGVGLLLFVVAAFLHTASHATIFVYDGFSSRQYVPGPLDGQSGGFGHSAWDATVYEEFTTLVEPHIDKGLHTPTVSGIGGRAGGNAKTWVNPSLGTMSPNGEPIYIGFLLDSPMRSINSNLHYAGIIFDKHYYPPDSWPVPCPPFLEEQFVFFYVGDTNGSNFVSLPGGELFDTFRNGPMHIVVEFQFSSNDLYTIRVYVDPPTNRSDAIPLGEWDGTNTTLRTPYTWLELHFSYLFNYSDRYCKMHFDELRVVNDWNDLFRPLYGDVLVRTAGAGTATPEVAEMVPVGTLTSVTFQAESEDYHISEIRLNGEGIFSNKSNRGTGSTNIPISVNGNITVEGVFQESRTTRGIPLAWLTRYGITNKQDSVELEDFDGDRLTTWEEWVADTDPTDEKSIFPRLMALYLDSIHLLIHPVSTQRLYEIEMKTNLSEQIWLTVTSAIPSSTSIQFEVPPLDARTMFFRSKVRIPE